MTRFRRLRKEALASCRFKGHKMGGKEIYAFGDKIRYVNWCCIKCGKYVTVTPKPYPNEIEIGGAAVSENCIGG